MSILVQTLRAASGREVLQENHAGTVTFTNNTVAGTQDGSDATYDGLLVEGIGAGAGDAAHVALYTMEAATFVGNADFVRLVMRAQRTGAPEIASLLGLYGVSAAGLIYLLDPIFNNELIATSFAEYATERAVDEASFLPWTAARVNAYKWGVEMVCSAVASLELRVPGFRLEVWGPGGTFVERSGVIDAAEAEGTIDSATATGVIDSVSQSGTLGQT